MGGITPYVGVQKGGGGYYGDGRPNPQLTT